jgi:hypothetical protein
MVQNVVICENMHAPIFSNDISGDTEVLNNGYLCCQAGHELGARRWRPRRGVTAIDRQPLLAALIVSSHTFKLLYTGAMEHHNIYD